MKTHKNWDRLTNDMLTLILYFFKQIPDLPVSDPNFYDITFTEETSNLKHEVRVRGISYASARKI